MHRLVPVLLLTLAAPAARAQTWVPVIPGSPEGAEASVLFDAASSAADVSVVEVVVPGFWVEEVVGDDGATYDRITVPGLETIGQPGAPELPAARFALALPEGVGEVSLLGVTRTGVVSFPDTNVYPAPIPGTDEEIDPTGDIGPGDPFGMPETFTKDDAIYGAGEVWPPTDDAGPYETQTFLGVVPGVACEVYPATFHTGDGEFQVAATTEWTYEHSGPPVAASPLTKGKFALAEGTFLNWPVQVIDWSFDDENYQARYLIVASSVYLSKLTPFVWHKKALGFQVEVRVPTAPTQFAVHDEIKAWYAAGSPSEEHYCLLVGDTNTIPLWDVPFVGKSDDVYGSVDGDFFKEINVGRLSVDGVSDLERQLEKIMAYETSPKVGGDYDEVLLVAHEENYPFKYTLAHELVRNASYATPPTFVQVYGALGATNTSVSTRIDDEVGLVAYRGHGSTSAWTNWYGEDDHWHSNDVLNLSNDVQPVVWSFACTNNNIGFLGDPLQDCIGEVWLEAVDKGGVAHYAATDTTGTSYNHALDKLLFKTVYDSGVLPHGMATDWTELILWISRGDAENAWLYNLLGDPAMKIRRKSYQPLIVNLQLPTSGLSLCGESLCEASVGFDVRDAFGAPAPEALVSLFKPSAIPGKPDEVLVNGYADDLGFIGFELMLATPGPLSWTVQDDDGVGASGTVDVTMGPAWTDELGGAPGAYGTPRLFGLGSLAGGTPMSLTLVQALEDTFATLVLGFDGLYAPFKGGVLVPSPDLLVGPFPTGADGTVQLATTWPAGIPSQTRFFAQFWLPDPAAPKGLAGSNGITGTTP